MAAPAAVVKTREISEAAVFYVHGLSLESYSENKWVFNDAGSKADGLRRSLFNKEIKVEPLEFMDAIRRVKAFSNERV